VQSRDAQSIYQVPLNLEAEGLAEQVCEKFGLDDRRLDLEEWRTMVRGILRPKGTVRIALVGKYVELKDAYISITEALHHAAVANHTAVEIVRIDSETLEDQGIEPLRGVNGVLVAPGFGARGIKGKLLAIRHARENDIPYLGICYGMQLACVEFARDVCGLELAHTREVEADTPHAVIDFMENQRNLKVLGGTMRLGTYPCALTPGSLAAKAYGTLDITERHRHRFEFNNKYRSVFERNGMVFSGLYVAAELVEIIELPSHRWFLGTQAHPEFKSRPTRPAPLYMTPSKRSSRHWRSTAARVCVLSSAEGLLQSPVNLVSPPFGTSMVAVIGGSPRPMPDAPSVIVIRGLAAGSYGEWQAVIGHPFRAFPMRLYPHHTLFDENGSLAQQDPGREAH